MISQLTDFYDENWLSELKFERGSNSPDYSDSGQFDVSSSSGETNVVDQAIESSLLVRESRSAQSKRVVQLLCFSSI